MKPNSNALETLHHSLKLEWIKQEQTNQMKKTASVEYDGKGAQVHLTKCMTLIDRLACLSNYNYIYIARGK